MTAKAVLGWGAFALFAVAMLVFVATQGGGPSATPADRITAACERQFAAQGGDAVADCKLQLMSEHLAAQQRANMEAARRASQ